MDKKLISEITKIQSMMGILVEQEQPLEPLVSGDLTIKYSNFAPDTKFKKTMFISMVCLTKILLN